MKNKFLTLLLAVSICILPTACNSNAPEASQPVVDDSESNNSESNSSDTNQNNDNSSNTSTENPSDEPASAPPEKQYNVYVNGKGYDKGACLQFKVSLKANDTSFTQCCPSVNIAYEGNTNPEEIYGFIELNEEVDSNPLLVCNTGSDEYNKEYYTFWAYYDLLARWNAPDAPPLDITDGIYVFTSEIKFLQPGKYTISVTSGNDNEDMAEEFAKYDNCFSFEIIEK